MTCYSPCTPRCTLGYPLRNKPKRTPIASQVAALRERGTTDGLVVPASMEFLDDGDSGAPLVRPALERLREAAAAGGSDRLYGHSPDRLARKYASQVLLVEEWGRFGVEVVFLNRELGRSPADDLRLQVHGMMAESERAKMIERHRRGKRHAARLGSVNVLRGAPYGDRYVTKHDGGGHARYDLIPDEVRMVRQIFAWSGRERLAMGAGCCRLMQAGERTRTGRLVWERSVVWAILKNPAYMSSAAVGKPRQGPLRPKLRAQRGRPLQADTLIQAVAGRSWCRRSEGPSGRWGFSSGECVIHGLGFTRLLDAGPQRRAFRCP